MKYKRGISLTLTAALLLSMLPQIVLPKAAAANIPEREIDSSTYAALGLSLNAEDKGASLTAPYSKKHVSQAFTASEVYVAGRLRPHGDQQPRFRCMGRRQQEQCAGQSGRRIYPLCRQRLRAAL